MGIAMAGELNSKFHQARPTSSLTAQWVSGAGMKRSMYRMPLTSSGRLTA